MNILIRSIVVFCFTLATVPAAYAAPGRTGQTQIERIIVKRNFVEIYTVAGSGTVGDANCPDNNRWFLMKDSGNTHNNFDALFSGLLTAKFAGTPVDLVGTGSCNGSGEIIDWAYVAY